jgi:dephospho-CoA kinase
MADSEVEVKVKLKVAKPGRAFCVGLTGGIGSGKSTASALFAARGASIIDVDKIAHELTAAHGAAMPQLLAEFGPDYADANGALDRNRMRKLVFDDPGAKARLQAILHPRIKQMALARADNASGSYVMFDVPLLVESSAWRNRVTRILVVDCPESVQIARVMARSGWPQIQVQAIMANQASRQARLAQADDIIDNAGSAAALEPQVDRLHRFYLSLSQKMAAIPLQHL